uniref:Ankyrin repeat protein n=2 Tax=Aureoumbra lagunensis TaxID=44058 RepID=A0A7S3NHU4_9STRA
MNAGVSPNLADDQRRTPLHHAAFAQALDIAQLLYDCGATIDLKDDGGNTPVHVASARGATDVLEFFMSCAADLEAANNDGDRPLHLAAYMGNRDCVQLLLHTGEVSITAMNSLGLTPLGNLVERAPIFIKNRDRTAAGKKPRRIPKEIQDTIRILEEANQDFSTPPTFSAHDRGE